MPSSLPPLRLLSAFAAVARTGSVRAAAAEMNVTQPAISQAVRQLEVHCGLRLLDRTRRPARPTEAGATLADAIGAGLGRIEHTLDALRVASLGGSQAVTVACSVGVATYWLMPRLTGFYDACPDYVVNVMTTQQGVPDLSDRVDLAIRFGHGRWSDGTVTHLFDEVIEPQCSPALLRDSAPGTVPDKAWLLHVKSPETSWMGWSDYLRRIGRAGPSGPGRSFTNYVQATQAAVEGQGLVLGWLSITSDLVAAGRLVPAGLPALSARDAFYLVSRPKRGSAAAAAFADWLLEARPFGAQAPANTFSAPPRP